jgi:signal transduction histidine kinase
VDSKLRILLIDDNMDDRMLYRRVLRGAFEEQPDFAEEANGESALAAIDRFVPDCILLDYSLPGYNGVEVLKQIRTEHPHLPVILLTGQGNEHIAVESMKEGAQDYITKSDITTEALGRTIRSAIRTNGLKKRVHEQHQALEIFTRALAHDLKEPVRTVQSFTRLVATGEVEGEARDTCLRHVADAGARMALLIDALLAYTQIDGLDMQAQEVFGLHHALDEAEANLHALLLERGTQLTSDPLPDAQGNRTQIIQLLQHLISNAAIHSPDPVKIHVSCIAEGGSLRITVSDTGPGIAERDQRRIFEPFRRLTRGGQHCGLGLAVCRKIVEAHGGRITCRSEDGKGASFTFTLPDTAPAIAEPAEEAGADAAPPASGKGGAAIANVLLVDDSVDDLMWARHTLVGPKGIKCNLYVAKAGEEGLATIRTQLRGGDPIDLVLLDINMPAMDGFEMLEAVAADAELKRTPVVMCSGSTWQKDRERARQLGALDYLVKPVSLPDLRQVIDTLPSVRLVQDESERIMLTRAA